MSCHEGFRGTYLAVEMDGYVAVEDLRVIDPDVERWLYLKPQAAADAAVRTAGARRGIDVAQQEMSALLDGLGREYPDTDGGIGARVVPEPYARPLPLKAVSEAIPLVRSLALVVAGSGAADRLPERREPAARARHGAAARDRGALGARRRARRG